MGDGYYYTLSAIAQSFAAIIALNGVFVIYKARALQSRRDELFNRLQQLWMEELINGSGYSQDHARAERELKRITIATILNWAGKHSGRGEIVMEKEKILSEYDWIEQFSKMIIQYFRTPVIFNGITIMISLALLPWRSIMPCFLQYTFVIVLLLWCFVSLLITLHSVFITLEQRGIGLVARFLKQK